MVPPASGMLACGEQGVGRLPELQVILDALLPLLHAPSLQGQHWVINAGPTVEAWDAVRTLSNRASGTLGAAMATWAAALGARVDLIAGIGTPATPLAVQRHDVVSTLEMLEQCEQCCDQSAKHVDCFVATAAVSDFRFAHVSSEKMKRKDTTEMAVALIANPDIVAHIAAMPKRPKKVVAFAAESSNHLAYANEKLVRKGVDAIVANDVSNMGQSRASGWWVTAKQAVAIEATSKQHFAYQLIQKMMEE